MDSIIENKSNCHKLCFSGRFFQATRGQPHVILVEDEGCRWYFKMINDSML